MIVYKTGEKSAQISIPDERWFSLVFWEENCSTEYNTDQFWYLSTYPQTIISSQMLSNVGRGIWSEGRQYIQHHHSMLQGLLLHKTAHTCWIFQACKWENTTTYTPYKSTNTTWQTICTNKPPLTEVTQSHYDSMNIGQLLIPNPSFCAHTKRCGIKFRLCLSVRW